MQISLLFILKIPLAYSVTIHKRPFFVLNASSSFIIFGWSNYLLLLIHTFKICISFNASFFSESVISSFYNYFIANNLSFDGIFAR